MLSESDNDDSEDGYLLTDPVLKFQRQIIERISVYNYLKICINIAWLVDKALPADADELQKINLSVLVLDSIHVLRQFRHIHHSMIENLYCLANNPAKLERLRKKISWFQYFASFIY